MDNYLEVDFKTYCEKCIHREKKDFEDPCNECLEVGMREGTRVPEQYMVCLQPKKSKRH